MDDEETEDKGYVWEAEYEKPWEAIQEDNEGRLLAPDRNELYKAKRRKLFDHKGQVKLGMMRHVYVILDMSSSMEEKDLKPNRLSCSKVVLKSFFEEFFDQNPISQMGLITTKNGRADKLSDLSGNLGQHSEALLKCVKCSGEASLQNALETAMKHLRASPEQYRIRASMIKRQGKQDNFKLIFTNTTSWKLLICSVMEKDIRSGLTFKQFLDEMLDDKRHLPTHSSREVIIIHGSLTSCDPDNIFKTIEELSSLSIQCSVIGLGAEVRLCHTICNSTQGTYSVVLDESHFKDLLMKHCRPPLAKENVEATLIKMGFPHHVSCGQLAVCMCHLDSKSHDYVTTSGYFCPQCQSKYCELPVECKICGLTLVLAPHLARSYHHLFPLPMFTEVKVSSNHERFCSSCQASMKEEVYVCPLCDQPFCIDCDLFCHEVLHNCPGCQSRIVQR